ncbi:hypothetical protein JOF36_002545 [Pseudonocardia parietis]|uniref:Uncharacterized protein n=1 Tax=Pseudonocardia parietis TaxID=570936 RepID=A0ABS4VTG6_9PSEU|nr:hypothetical protein [Pseudonocardia parietis]
MTGLVAASAAVAGHVRRVGAGGLEPDLFACRREPRLGCPGVGSGARTRCDRRAVTSGDGDSADAAAWASPRTNSTAAHSGRQSVREVETETVTHASPIRLIRDGCSGRPHRDTGPLPGQHTSWRRYRRHRRLSLRSHAKTIGLTTYQYKVSCISSCSAAGAWTPAQQSQPPPTCTAWSEPGRGNSRLIPSRATSSGRAHSLQGAVAPLVEPPVGPHRRFCRPGGDQSAGNDPSPLRGPGQHRRAHDGRGAPVGDEQFRRPERLSPCSAVPQRYEHGGRVGSDRGQSGMM